MLVMTILGGNSGIRTKQGYRQKQRNKEQAR
jgi:hypothetical protein